MLASRGMPVTYLKRIAEDGLELGDLPLGQVREVALEELEHGQNV
jgi:16S rRNA U516 pseudouridylate synthase RsuA-like enzyme